MCGLCGNYNGDEADDFKTPKGSLINSERDFGDSWEFTKMTEDCGVPPPPPNCSTDLLGEATERCRGVLAGSIFQLCSSVVHRSYTLCLSLYV